MSTWDSLNSGERVEFGLLQIDIASHSKLQDTDLVLKDAKSTFRQLIEGIVQTRGGRRFNWAGDGGSFMFLVKTGEGFNSMCFSALQILNTLPAINEEITIRTRFKDTLSVRISCDSGVAVYDNDPFMSPLIKLFGNVSHSDFPTPLVERCPCFTTFGD